MKEMLKRALRTFVQAAIGYIAANSLMLMAGSGSGVTLKSALTALLSAAVASGLAAVMNIPRGVSGQSASSPGAEDDENQQTEDRDE